jgi:hypothetical protein
MQIKKKVWIIYTIYLSLYVQLETLKTSAFLKNNSTEHSSP